MDNFWLYLSDIVDISLNEEFVMCQTSEGSRFKEKRWLLSLFGVCPNMLVAYARQGMRFMAV